MKNDGTIEIKNDAFTATYNPDGTKTETNGLYNQLVGVDGSVTINGLIIGPDGSLTSPVAVTAPTVAAVTSLTIASVEVGAHSHGGVSAGTDNSAPMA